VTSAYYTDLTWRRMIEGMKFVGYTVRCGLDLLPIQRRLSVMVALIQVRTSPFFHQIVKHGNVFLKKAISIVGILAEAKLKRVFSYIFVQSNVHRVIFLLECI